MKHFPELELFPLNLSCLACFGFMLISLTSCSTEPPEGEEETVEDQSSVTASETDETVDEPEEQPPVEVTVEINDPKSDLLALIENLECSAHADCRAVGVGRYHGWGYAGHELYSRKNADETEVKRLSKEIWDLDESVQTDFEGDFLNSAHPYTRCSSATPRICEKLDQDSPIANTIVNGPIYQGGLGLHDIDGDFIYAVHETQDVYVLKRTGDDVAPVAFVSLGFDIIDLKIIEGTLYALGANALSAIDYSTPLSPTIADSLTLSNTAQGLAGTGTSVFVVSTTGSGESEAGIITSVDATDTANLALGSELALATPSRSIEVDGNTALVGSSTGILYLVDISSIGSMTLTGSKDLGNGESIKLLELSYPTDDSTIYAGQGEKMLFSIDYSDPSMIREIDSLEMEPHHLLSDIHANKNGYLYMCNLLKMVGVKVETDGTMGVADIVGTGCKTVIGTGDDLSTTTDPDYEVIGTFQ